MTVKVSSSFYEEICEIKESGDVDLTDADAVFEYAKKNGFSVTERMVQGNPARYLRCINDGMEPMD